jgi:CRP/FNR family transcriptional regulator
MSACAQCLARQGTLCGALDEATRGRLLSIAHPEQQAAGRWLVQPGASADAVFILRAGHAHVARLTHEGKRQILAFLFPGDFFAFTYEQHYAYGAWAATDVALCRLTRRQLEALVTATPALERRIRTQVTRQLDSAQELVFTLGRKTAIERVASFLWYLDYRQRKLGRPGATTDIPMSRADIADFLGLTSESVSRSLTRLRRAGLISLPAADQVGILDMPRLRSIGVVEAEPVPEQPTG